MTPDLTSLAKIVAGGLPGGALVGKKEILNLISIREQEASDEQKKCLTLGLSMPSAYCSRGNRNVKHVKTGEPHRHVNRMADELRDGFNDVIDNRGLDWASYGEFSCIKMLVGHGEKGRAKDFDPHEWDYRRLKRRVSRICW